MRNFLTILVGAAVVIGIIYALSQYEESHPSLEGEAKYSPLVGKPAPDFEGDFAVNGQPVRLSSLKGKVILLDFWAVWCGPCIKAFPHLRQWYQDYHEQGFEVVGLTMYENYEGNKREEQAGFKKFAMEHRLSYLLMTQAPSEYDYTRSRYRVEAYPTLVLIDRKGIIRMYVVGLTREKAIEANIKALLAERG